MAKNKVILSWLGKDPKDKAVNIAVLVAVAVGVFFLFRYIVRKIRGLNMQERQELNTVLDTGVKLSYSNFQYDNFAMALYRAMNGLGTDENAIYSVFSQMNNIADVLKLITSFGYRDDEDLTSWIYDDLSSAEIAKLNNILAAKGINYKF